MGAYNNVLYKNVNLNKGRFLVGYLDWQNVKGRFLAGYLDWQNFITVPFPNLFNISLPPNGSVADIWDSICLYWQIPDRRSWKDNEIIEFSALLSVLEEIEVSNSPTSKCWVKFLSRYLATSSSIVKGAFPPLWKCNYPKRIYIIIWILINGGLNFYRYLQNKIPSSLMPSRCPLCCSESESLNHPLFY